VFAYSGCIASHRQNHEKWQTYFERKKKWYRMMVYKHCLRVKPIVKIALEGFTYMKTEMDEKGLST